MKRLFLLAALWLAGCSAAPEITSSPEPTEFSLTAPVEAATMTPTTAPTRTPALFITATPASFDVNREALPIAPGEILYRHENELRIVGPDGSNNRRLFSGDIGIGVPLISPGGRYLALSARQPLALDLQTGDVIALSERKQSALASFFWAPGDILYYVWYEKDSDWKTWRVEMPMTSAQAVAYDPPEGSVVIGVLDDMRLIVDVPVSDSERQTALLNWRTGERRLLAEPGYRLISVSEDHSHALLFGPGDIQEGGWPVGFYIAEFGLEDGVGALHRIMPTAGRFYNNNPRLSPDGRRVMAERLIAPDILLTDLVLIELSETGSYQEIPVAPQAGWLCWGGLWYGSDTLIASCHKRDEDRERSSLWRIPLDGGPAVRLADEGHLTP